MVNEQPGIKYWSCCSDFTDFLVGDTSYLDYFQVRENTRIFLTNYLVEGLKEISLTINTVTQHTAKW